MLITLYELTNSRFHVAKQYYWWRVPQIDELPEDHPATSIDCPGCGRNLTRLQIRNNHQCPGTKTTYPVPDELFRTGAGRRPRRPVNEDPQRRRDFLAGRSPRMPFDPAIMVDNPIPRLAKLSAAVGQSSV